MITLNYNDTNKQQDYATHSIFRYFGKLPPTLVSLLLNKYNKPKGKVLELMCGSGTTMLEAYLHSMPAIGVDINPLSILISKTKVTKIPISMLLNLKTDLESYLSNTPKVACSYFRPKTRNLDYWFTPLAQEKLSAIKYFIDNGDFLKYCLRSEQVQDLLRTTFASIIRKVSNASPRTGRIFYCSENSCVDAYQLMLKKLESNIIAIANLPDTNEEYIAMVADARKTGLCSSSFDFILNHPPYFALYKYSSDVLRFELEWLDFNRSTIAKGEIEDGFKTTNACLLENYITDMQNVFREMHRLMKNDATSCVVVSDSKLREEQLPVVKQLIDVAQLSRLKLYSHQLRPVSFTQASYHKSANPNIRTNEDHILIFKKSSCT